MIKEKTGNRYVILGSGIAGMAAAEAIRERDPEGSILMISAEKELCFNRPMLISEFALDGSGAALFEKQQDWPERFGVDLRLSTEIRAIGRETKTVQAQRMQMENAGACSPGCSPSNAKAGQAGSEHAVSYDKLIYALGAQAAIPPIPGTDREHVHVVRTREDMRRIRRSMETAEHAVVIGGGMLGLEDAWALREQKLEVAIIERRQRVAFGQIDQSAGNLMKKRIERMGVPVYLNAEVTEIGEGYVTFRQEEMDNAVPEERDARESRSRDCPAAEASRTEEELITIPADLVILSVGVTPCSALGEAAGLAVTDTAGATPEKRSAGEGAPGKLSAGEGEPEKLPAGEGVPEKSSAETGGSPEPYCREAEHPGRISAGMCSGCGCDCPAICGGGSRWIQVDDRCRTSDPDIYAAGDCAAVKGRNDAIWDEAREMGRVAGANAALSQMEEAGQQEREDSVAAGKPAFSNISGAVLFQTYRPVIPEHVFIGFDTEVFTMADSSGAGTDGVYIRHADVEIFDYQRERYIRASLQDGRLAGILLINAPELAPDLMEAYRRGASEDEVRQIIQTWKDSHEVDFRPATPFRRR